MGDRGFGWQWIPDLHSLKKLKQQVSTPGPWSKYRSEHPQHTLISMTLEGHLDNHFVLIQVAHGRVLVQEGLCSAWMEGRVDDGRVRAGGKAGQRPLATWSLNCQLTLRCRGGPSDSSAARSAQQQWGQSTSPGTTRDSHASRRIPELPTSPVSE